MRTVLLAAVLAFPVVGAQAGQPDDAAAEARSYLAVCPFPAGSEAHGGCVAVAADFVQQYQSAMAGDAAAQKNVAVWLMDGGMGLPRNPTQACAWALVSVLSDLAHATGAAIEGVRTWCAPAGDAGWDVAGSRARQILGMIAKNP